MTCSIKRGNVARIAQEAGDILVLQPVHQRQRVGPGDLGTEGNKGGVHFRDSCRVWEGKDRRTAQGAERRMPMAAEQPLRQFPRAHQALASHTATGTLRPA